MSPDGVEDKNAEIQDLGFMLYTLNQGFTPKGEAIDVQPNALGVNTSELDYVDITGKDGKFVLLTSEGAYSQKNWKDLVLPGIHANLKRQLKSLEWIRETCIDSNCVQILSSHDQNVEPRIVELDI